MNYSLSLMLGSSRLFDRDAAAYIKAVKDAGATVTSPQSSKINDFYKLAKKDGYYTSLKRLYLPIWGVAAANAIDMVTRNSGTFVGEVTHGAGFVQGNGTTGYFNFGTSPQTLGLNPNGGMVGVLVNQAGTIANGRYISAENGSTLIQILQGGTGNTVCNSQFFVGISSLTFASETANSGIFTLVRENSTSQRLTVRKTSGVTNSTIQTTTASGTITENLVALARNDDGVVYAFTNGRAGAYFAADTGFKYANENSFTLHLKNLWEGCTGLTIP
jgi:hypothetical protein